MTRVFIKATKAGRSSYIGFTFNGDPLEAVVFDCSFRAALVNEGYTVEVSSSEAHYGHVSTADATDLKAVCSILNSVAAQF